MERCKKCHMPDTRPNTQFTSGVCGACVNAMTRQETNIVDRQKELFKIADKHRNNKGEYDCVIPVSGGKDSYFQVKIVKEKLDMNPLLVTVCDPFTKSIAGKNNLNNLSEVFSCDQSLFVINPDVFKRATRLAFETFGEPLRFIESAIYIYPYKLAVQLGIPLVFFGESPFEYGGEEETANANGHIQSIAQRFDIDFWLKNGFAMKNLNSVTLNETTSQALFLSYFYRPWDSTLHYEVAKRYGFQDLYHEWKREGYIEDFEQIDSLGYLVHLWLKYPKFGFQRVCDIVSRRIRLGYISYEDGKRYIDENDYKLDFKAMDDFCNILGYSRKEFWDIVEKFWNANIFYRDEFDVWRLKGSDKKC